MKAIYKYLIPREDNPVVLMPKGARPYTVGMQDGEIRTWALINPDLKAPTVRHQFAVRGTGHPIMPEIEQAHFLGTVFEVIHGHNLVWHVFSLGDIDD